MGTNLGALLQQAGIQGGRAVQPKLTLADVKSMARPSNDRVVFSNEAMSRLPLPAFADALNTHQVQTWQEFLACVMRGLEIVDDSQFNEHTLIGLSQLAHWHRDRPELSPSKRKAFSQFVIPLMLELKSGKGRPGNISLRKFVYEQIRCNRR